MKPLSNLKRLTFLFVALLPVVVHSQSIGTFNSVAPGGQPNTLMLPATHTFQRLIKTNDPLTLGGNLGGNLDFTGYVPIAGSSTNGYLSVSSENTVAEIAILSIYYNTPTHRWVISSSGKVSFPAADLGTVARFCSGTVSPNGTIFVGEESTASGDVNGDGYEDVGWLIEVNPATRTVINQNGTGGVDKLWAAGRQSHENCVIKSDNSAIYWGADANPTGYLYKFVPTVPGNWTAGNLYVLDMVTAGSTTGAGTWDLIANTTPAQRNATVAASTSTGATNFNGIEDVEIGPDGRIYFTAKGEGKVYRFTDNGTYGTPTDVTSMAVFVGNDAYPTIRSYDVDGAGPLGTQPWNTGNDNLAFDGEGNLWVLNDGGGGDIWVVGPTHTQASPQVRLFARTPAGGEPTGITFTPDYRYMFLSFQHPTATGTQTDAAGATVTFNDHTTVVIARNEFLGPFSTLPVRYTMFDAKQVGGGVSVDWTATNFNNHDYFSVERSIDGINFSEISRVDDDLDGIDERTFNVQDNNLPGVSVVYYRVKQCDQSGICNYTEVKPVKLSTRGQVVRIYPQPVQDELTVKYLSFTEGPGTVTITDFNGKVISHETRNLAKGTQSIQINTSLLNSGMYMITITDKLFQSTTEKFVKN